MSDSDKNPKTMEEAYEPETANIKTWAAFVEGPALDFFQGYKLEKMSIDDGNGNKAKLTKKKDCGVKVEYSATKDI